MPVVEPVHGSLFGTPAEPMLELEQSVETLAPSPSVAPSADQQGFASPAPAARDAPSEIARGAAESRQAISQTAAAAVPSGADIRAGSTPAPHAGSDRPATAAAGAQAAGAPGAGAPPTRNLPALGPAEPRGESPATPRGRPSAEIASATPAPPAVADTRRPALEAEEIRLADERVSSASPRSHSSVQAAVPLDVVDERGAQSDRTSTQRSEASSPSAARAAAPRDIVSSAKEVTVEIERSPLHPRAQLATVDQPPRSGDGTGSADTVVARRHSERHELAIDHSQEREPASTPRRGMLEEHDTATLRPARADAVSLTTPPAQLPARDEDQPPAPELRQRTNAVPPWVDPAQGRRPEPPGAPTIHVSIGRIEVRAAPPPPAPPAPRPDRRPTPALSLNEYLRRRDEGHRV